MNEAAGMVRMDGSTTTTQTSETVIRSPRRLFLAGLGVLCVGLAVAGMVIPGLPTTIFLIAASYLFTRSCPWLEERLIRNRLFRPYLRYLDGSAPMPLRARVTTILMIWTAVTVSLALLTARGQLGIGLGATILAAALVGTGVVATWGRAEARD